MHVIALYISVVLIWGSTWLAISFQMGIVATELSVAYRSCIAAIVLYLYALLSRRKIRLPTDAYPMVLLQGTLLFCLNYFFVYYGTKHLTTGLVAVLFSSIVLANTIFERLFFRTPFEKKLLFAFLFGVTGISMIFWPEIDTLSLEDDTVFGIAMVLVAVLIASLGNMTAVVNTRRDLPVVAVNAHALAWAAIVAFLISALLGRDFIFDTRVSYIASLLYLAVFGSAIAFGCYLALIRRIGAARAAYSAVLLPIVALAISSVAEDYVWTPLSAGGIVLTLIGNWLVLSRSKPNSQTISDQPNADQPKAEQPEGTHNE
jgi:drug/metabolite transporter (DMT)-like permease